MFAPFVHIAIEKAGSLEERAMLEEALPLAHLLDEAEASFEARINASKAARGEGPTKLSKTKRQEVDQYAEDARQLEAQQLDEFRALPAASDIVFALRSGLETDVTLWKKAVPKVHPAEQPVVSEFLDAKVRLCEQLGRFLEKFPAV